MVNTHWLVRALADLSDPGWGRPEKLIATQEQTATFAPRISNCATIEPKYGNNEAVANTRN